MNTYEYFVEAKSDAQLAELKGILAEGGYPVFYRFLESFKGYIKSFLDGDAEEVKALIAKARKAVPDPGSISPSWTYIWDQLDKMAEHKLKVLAAVPQSERDGEWQVLIDNPYENREVACYPGLKFMDAAYVFAQFRPDLEHNEYIRLQKIQTHITEFGE